MDELNGHSFLGEQLDRVPEVIEVAGQSVHAVDDDRVAIAGERQQFLELGTIGVLAGYLVRERLVNLNPFKLPIRILAERDASWATVW
jgi:hypothetical protein